MLVALLGLVISLFVYLLAFPLPHQRRFDVFGVILALHILGAVAYWLFSFESGTDAYTYYRDPFGHGRESALQSGTHFIVHVVKFIRETLGGSLLDHFLFFQCFGMIGIALLMRSMNEIAESLNITVPVHLYGIFLLPGLHFWSAGIGKDAPMIMAACLSLWAALKINRRVVWMAVALGVMALIRPHVAAISMVAIAGALLLSGHLSFKARIALAPLAGAGLVLFVGQASEQFNVALDPTAISDFVDHTQSFEQQHGSGVSLKELPFPLKVWALLFRPFFFDSKAGFMHLAASIENAALLSFFVYVAIHARLLFRLARKVFFLAYGVFFSSILIVMLALVNYNIGLGQRQKMMAVPAVLLIAASIYLYKRYLRTTSAELAFQEMPRPLPEGSVVKG